MRNRAAICVGVALLATQAGLVAWMGWRYSPTIDEPAHLAAGISHWKFGRFDLYRVNPPLVRLLAAVPMLAVDPKTDWSAFTEAPYARPEFSVGRAFTSANGSETFWHFTLARWACLPLVLLGGWISWRWARELYGDAAGLVALALWCFCPTVLGNGALITPDASAASLGVTAAYCFWRWLSAPGWPAAALAGAALGLAELTKSTSVVLFALWPALWIVWRCCGKRGAHSPAPRSAFRAPRWIELAAILGIGLYLLNLGYGFENSFRPLGQFQFISQALGGPEAHDRPGNRFADSWRGAIPVPAPAHYLAGIDVQRFDFEKKKYSYLRGEQRLGGWWYYPLYALLVKVPLGTLFLVGLAGGLALGRVAGALRKRGGGSSAASAGDAFAPGRATRRDELVVLAPAIVVLVLVCSQTGFSRYVRYVLPIFPFVFVWTSQVGRLLTGLCCCVAGAAPATPPAQSASNVRSHAGTLPWGRRIAALVVVAAVASTAVSSLRVFPHSLSYFNEAAGGPERGAEHLLDANIDWGQDLLYLAEWYRAHPEDRPLHLSFFGYTDPRAAGIEFEPVPRGPAASSLPAPGWHAISVNNLYGYKHGGGEEDAYAWLRELEPVARIGYSIVIYHVEAPQR